MFSLFLICRKSEWECHKTCADGGKRGCWALSDDDNGGSDIGCSGVSKWTRRKFNGTGRCGNSTNGILLSSS